MVQRLSWGVSASPAFIRYTRDILSIGFGRCHLQLMSFLGKTSRGQVITVNKRNSGEKSVFAKSISNHRLKYIQQTTCNSINLVLQCSVVFIREALGNISPASLVRNQLSQRQFRDRDLLYVIRVINDTYLSSSITFIAQLYLHEESLFVV